LRLLVVGCGQMGGWFARHLSSLGHSLELYDVDRNAAERLASEVGGRPIGDLRESGGGDGVIVAVPSRAARGALRELGSLPKRYGFVVEISALKGPVAGEVRRLRRKGMTVVMLHPLFGPRTKDLEGTVAVHVEPGDEEAERSVIDRILPGTRVITMGLREHDASVRYSVGLTHFIGLAAALALSRSAAEPLPTNSMGALMRLVEIALSESDSFYLDEPMRSAASMRVMRAFLRECERTLDLLERGALPSHLRRARNRFKSIREQCVRGNGV